MSEHFDDSGEHELIQRLRALLRARGTPGILICANDHADAKEQLGLLREIMGVIVRDMP